MHHLGWFCCAGSIFWSKTCSVLFIVLAAWEVRQILRIAGVDRLTCSVIWEMTGEGRILKQWSGRTVIRSCAKLAYDHAQDMIEGSFSASKPPVPLSAPHTWDQVGATSHMSLAQGPFMPSSSRPHGIP